MEKTNKMTGIELIAKERQEQIEKHGWDTDDDYITGELLQGAKFCVTLKSSDYPKYWDEWFMNNVKVKQKRMSAIEFKIEMAKIAGAFCAAEIDRLQRLARLDNKI